jgi:hypothetical protein
MQGSLDRLIATIRSGEAMLFTGAGFSKNARDVDGQLLPDSEQMRDELWTMCFPNTPPDDSTLCDLYDVALALDPDQLAAYLGNRLRIGSEP